MGRESSKPWAMTSAVSPDFVVCLGPVVTFLRDYEHQLQLTSTHQFQVSICSCIVGNLADITGNLPVARSIPLSWMQYLVQRGPSG